jgi:hypothetical protein
MHESRSSAPAQLTLDGLELTVQQGVGGRHGRPGRRRRGGGYLNECISPNVWEDAKIRELETMGLPGVWVAVAREIGYEHFMAMWRILDRSVQMRSESESMIEVQLRRLSSYQRFQRNRFIESLVAAGFGDKAIREMVRDQLGEKLSLSHISRLAGRRKVRSAA